MLVAGYTAEQVVAFKDWWDADDWRAAHMPVPRLDQVVEKIKQSLSGNHRRPREDSTEQAIRELLEENAEYERRRAADTF